MTQNSDGEATFLEILGELSLFFITITPKSTQTWCGKTC